MSKTLARQSIRVSALPSSSSSGRRGRAVAEPLERRQLLAAHVAGSAAVYATIQAAVDAALAGGTVTVDPGTYAEKVTISKPLTIQGAKAGVDARGAARANSAGAGESIVTGSLKSGVSSSAFYVNANGVTIDGFTVQGETDQSLTAGAGIVVAADRSGTKILNNVVQRNVSGLFLSNGSATDPAVVQYNLFRNNNNAGPNGGRAIYADQGIFGARLTNVTIDSNTFLNNYGGDGTTNLEAAIALEATVAGRVTDVRITNNSMSGNGKAVLAYNAANLLIQGNTITGTQDQYSGTLRFEGNVRNATIQFNTVYNNTGPAVSVDSKATAGDSAGFVARFNNFYGNNSAYAVPISVVFEAARYEGSFDARFNYWGSATGPSGNGTGTGDAASAGVFQPGAGLGWKLLPGGDLQLGSWAAIANAQLGLLPAAPVALSAVTSGLSQVVLNWTDANAGVGVTGFVVQRAADGVNFSPVATVAAGVTRYVDAAVAPGTSYAYRVVATNVNGTSAPSAVAGDSTPAAGSTATNLSALTWTSATTGYGTVRKNLSVAGNPLTLNGVVYATGLGVHAVSSVVYDLAGAYAGFTSDIGVDAAVNGKGTAHVIFQVVGDGVTLFDSGVVVNPAAPVSINVSVVGVRTLTLIVNSVVAGIIDYAHADWAGAKLVASPTVVPPTVPPPPPVATAPAAPTAVSAVAVSATLVNLTWASVAAGVTGFVVQRSVDGGATFVPLATVPVGTLAYADATVVAGTTYAYGVAAVGAGGTSALAAAAAVTTPAAPPVTPPATPITTYLSDLAWASATTGYGSVQKDLSVVGNPIRLNGVAYAKGIGAHAVSTVTYNLGGTYTRFQSDVGVDWAVAGKGNASVRFKVLGDGVVLFDSGNLSVSSPAVGVDVSVAGVRTLTLSATNGIAGTIDYDHADWAGARLTSSSAQPVAAPTNLLAVAASTTQVNLTWANAAPNATGFVIQRATGTTGVYAQVAATAAGVTAYADKTVVAGTSYSYQVIAVSGTVRSAPSAAATATTLAASTVVTNLGALQWTTATAGWGTTQRNVSIVGNAISLRGTTYATGVGTHASSSISYNLGGRYSTFLSDVGVDDEVLGKGLGAVVFQVYGDGKLLFDSGLLTAASAVASLSVNVTGVTTLTLVAANGVQDNMDYNHADWAGARLIA